MKPSLSLFKAQIPVLLFFGSILLLFPLTVSSQANDGRILNTALADTRAYIDWATEKLHIILSAPIDSSEGRNRSTLLNRKESELGQLFPSLFPYFLTSIRIDSNRTYDDLIKEQPNLLKNLAAMHTQAELISSKPSVDLKSITMEYLFPIKPYLNSPLINFQQALELEKVLEWHPKADYTGLIIHAGGRLPWYGSDRETTIVAALFPRILDEDGRVVLDAGNLLPPAAMGWGMLAYSSEIRPELQTNRVGPLPYITMARALFGNSPTDLVISRADATMLLYNESTRRALREGRIIVVVDKSSLNQASSN